MGTLTIYVFLNGDGSPNYHVGVIESSRDLQKKRGDRTGPEFSRFLQGVYAERGVRTLEDARRVAIEVLNTQSPPNIFYLPVEGLLVEVRET
jgi:hypothetical protein